MIDLLYLTPPFSVGSLVETTVCPRAPPSPISSLRGSSRGPGRWSGATAHAAKHSYLLRGHPTALPTISTVSDPVCVLLTAARLVHLNTFVPLTHQVLRLWERSMVLEDLIHRYFEDLVSAGVHLSTRKIRSALERSGASILGPSTAPWRQLWPSAREE